MQSTSAEPLRVLVCGSRHWSDADLIRRTLAGLPPGAVVIHGAAPGADTPAGQAAAELGLRVLAFPADWARYARQAGPIRNQKMLDEGRPDVLIAFHEDLARSRGTLDMIQRARRAGLPVCLLSLNGRPVWLTSQHTRRFPCTIMIHG